MYFYLSTLSICLLILLVVIVVMLILEKRQEKKEQESSLYPEPPTPRSFPIIGHLHLLGGYEVPYQAFIDLGKKYGNIIKLKLGSVNSVVVNGQQNIREVLITKGHHFDSRPNFERYQQLFGGDKENSLAFCDWSEAQRARREMLRAYTFPRMYTNKFSNLEEIVGDETSKLIASIGTDCHDIKPLILYTCANIFTKHFCSKSFGSDDPGFVEMIENFDEIFYEVNQGYAADFLPFLLPLHYSRITRMKDLTHIIRNFIEVNVIGNRFDNFNNSEPTDYVESLIQHVKDEDSAQIDWNSALYALEDIIGGHAAVGNFFTKLLGFLVKEQEVQAKIQQEIDLVTENGAKNVTLSHKQFMPYTDATIFEVIRLISSPIVPRVSNQETSVNGLRIPKNTLIFLNNYELSMSEKLWEEPTQFKPERFIVDGHIVKPEHFLPFGGGRRSCMGYKMVQLISFGILTALLQHFTILPLDHETYKVPIGNLALPKDTFKFKFVKRK